MKIWIGKWIFLFFCLGVGCFPVMGQSISIEDESVDILQESEESLIEELDLLEETDIEDDHFEAFSDDSEMASEVETTPFTEFMEDARFSLNHQLGYGFQTPQKVVSHRSSLRVEWESDFGENYLFHFDGKTTIHYSNDHLTKAQDPSLEYLTTLNLREVYLQSSFDSWAFKAGKQIIIWGESDSSVLDEVSPQDQREVYFTSGEDARIGQNLVRVNYFTSQWEWDSFINPDPQTNLFPEKNTEYYIALPEDDSTINVHETRPSQIEVGVRLKRYLESGDLAFFAANLYENNPIYEVKPNSSGAVNHLEKKYPQYQLLGIGGNLNVGRSLLKAELAHKSGKLFTAKNSAQPLFMKNTLEAALDAEYQTANNTNLFIGISDRHVLEWENGMNIHEDIIHYFLGGNHSFYNQTLNVDYTLIYDKQEADTIHRLTTKYKIIDDLNLQISTVYFDPSDSEKGLGLFKEKSRVTSNLTYYF